MVSSRGAPRGEPVTVRMFEQQGFPPTTTPGVRHNTPPPLCRSLSSRSHSPPTLLPLLSPHRSPAPPGLPALLSSGPSAPPVSPIPSPMASYTYSRSHIGPSQYIYFPFTLPRLIYWGTNFTMAFYGCDIPGECEVCGQEYQRYLIYVTTASSPPIVLYVYVHHSGRVCACDACHRRTTWRV